MARISRFYVRLVVTTYAVVLVTMLFTVLLTRLIGGEAVAWAWAGVERNADWQPVFGLSPGGIEFALVPAGCFMMGSTDEQVEAVFQQCEVDRGDGNCERDWYRREQPIHQQCFDNPFWIGRTEVTNAQYQACVVAGACLVSGYVVDALRWNELQQPLLSTNWFQARDFAAWAGCRLSTEAQWEYAARGLDGLTYPWGDEFDGSRLNYCDANCGFDWRDENVDDGYAGTAPVGSYSPAGDSWVGAADMAGNRWEWTSTIYQDYPYDADDGRENPDDTIAGRVVRGGSWRGGSWRLDDRARAAYRVNGHPTYGDLGPGIRLVCGRPSS